MTEETQDNNRQFDQWLKTERIISVVTAAVIFAAAAYLWLVYPSYARQLTIWENLVLGVMVFAGVYELWNLRKPTFIRNKLANMKPRQQYWSALLLGLFALGGIAGGLVDGDLPRFLFGVASALLAIYSIWRARQAAKLNIGAT